MYTILPFNFTPFDDSFLLVNEAGVFTFLEQKDFEDFIRHNLSENSPVFDNLESDLFLTQEMLIRLFANLLPDTAPVRNICAISQACT